MTRTDVMASSRPRTAGAAPIRRGWSGTSRALLVLPVALLMSLALVLPSTAAAAAEPNTSNYSTTPPTTTPTTGTLPSKEAKEPTTSTPAKETAPAKETTPTTTTPTTTAKELPFTGFDLRWDVAFGVLLLGAGIAILTMQRRQRRHSGR